MLHESAGVNESAGVKDTVLWFKILRVSKILFSFVRAPDVAEIVGARVQDTYRVPPRG